MSIGTIILIVSLLSSVFGVFFAIFQHDLKKMLAFHSIENIGIIGIGIGAGLIGKAIGNPVICMLGFSGAFLHVVNHSLFKSLLFYCAGSVYNQCHTRDVNELGGLIKKMPRTALLFLLASVAICGLPPLNGFISEFRILEGNPTDVQFVIPAIKHHRKLFGHPPTECAGDRGLHSAENERQAKALGVKRIRNDSICFH